MKNLPKGLPKIYTVSPNYDENCYEKLDIFIKAEILKYYLDYIYIEDEMDIENKHYEKTRYCWRIDKQLTLNYTKIDEFTKSFLKKYNQLVLEYNNKFYTVNGEVQYFDGKPEYESDYTTQLTIRKDLNEQYILSIGISSIWVDSDVYEFSESRVVPFDQILELLELFSQVGVYDTNDIYILGKGRE